MKGRGVRTAELQTLVGEDIIKPRQWRAMRLLHSICVLLQRSNWRPFRAHHREGWRFPGLKPWAEPRSPFGASNHRKLCLSSCHSGQPGCVAPPLAERPCNFPGRVDWRAVACNLGSSTILKKQSGTLRLSQSLGIHFRNLGGYRGKFIRHPRPKFGLSVVH